MLFQLDATLGFIMSLVQIGLWSLSGNKQNLIRGALYKAQHFWCLGKASLIPVEEWLWNSGKVISSSRSMNLASSLDLWMEAGSWTSENQTGCNPGLVDGPSPTFTLVLSWCKLTWKTYPHWLCACVVGPLRCHLPRSLNKTRSHRDFQCKRLTSRCCCVPQQEVNSAGELFREIHCMKKL